jgi:hypothetical protein
VTQEGEYLIVGGTSSEKVSKSVGGVMLLKTDSFGNEIWQKSYGGKGYDSGWTITEGHSGGYLLGGVTTSFGSGGMDAYLIMVDDEGNEIWSKTFGSKLDETISMVQQAEDGGYFLVGNSVDPKDFIADPGMAGYGGFEGRSNIFVVKTDGEGNEIWSKTIESEFNILTSAGLSSKNGGYYVLASIVYFPEQGDDLLLLKLDEEGNEVWTRTWEEDSMVGNAMIQDSEGNLIITGRVDFGEGHGPDVIVLKVNRQGEEIWKKNYGDEIFFEIGRDIVETTSGDYVILADKLTSFYISDMFTLLISFDNAGNFLWLRELDIPYELKSGTMVQDSNGNFILTGGAVVSGRRFSTILIKTDQEGYVSQ